jgi:phosphoserine phosphatase RsbU/P
VAKPPSPQKHLRLYTEQPPQNVRPQIEAVACLPELFRAFQSTTGWTLGYLSSPQSDPPAGLNWSTPVRGGPGFAPGFLVLEGPDEKKEGGRRKGDRSAGAARWAAAGTAPGPEVRGPTPEFIAPSPSPLLPRTAIGDRDQIRRLAGSIGELLSELLDTRRALWQREAELAAGVPLIPHREEEKHLAARLEAVLRAGAEAVGGNASALYLLDEATTELKLRCSWGLPFDRLVAPARPLKGAMADLEALLGHAVVLDDDRVLRMWSVPEDFATAVCVPVSSPTTLLGTLWVFCTEKRGFDDRETNVLEVVAGRLAADLEREMLLRAGTDGAKLQKQVLAAERLQRGGLPTIPPLLDGWDVAGSTVQAEGIGGAFHDWFCLPRGLLAVAVGKAAEQGGAGGPTANAVRTAVRAHARYQIEAERLLQQVNLTLWTGSAGDQRAALFCGLVETATGRVCCSSAGGLAVLRLHADGWESLGQHGRDLGESPEADFEQFGHELQPGETLLIFSAGQKGATESAVQAVGERVGGQMDLSAEELVAAARETLDAQAVASDLAVLAVKHVAS